MLPSLPIFIALAISPFGSHGAPVQADDVCPRIADVLCVREVLVAIASMTKNINRSLNELETSVLEKVHIIDTVSYYINYEMEFIHTHLPKPQFHTQFNQLNNINQNHLTQLFLEAHYAMSFYYSSINDILNRRDFIAGSTDAWLSKIQSSLRTDMICRYRSILNVYSYTWPSIDEVGHIGFSKGKYHDAPSMGHEIRTIVIVRLLREWMRRIHQVITNVDMKFA